MEYAKVTTTDKKSVILKNPKWKGEYFVGIEVNKYGDEVFSRGYTERQHIIHESVIKNIRYMVWDLKYAVLK